MNAGGAHFHFGGRIGGNVGNVLPMSAFSAYNILRNYNYLLTPQNADFHTKTQSPRLASNCPLQSTSSDEVPVITCMNEEHFIGLSPKPLVAPSPLFNYNTGIFATETDLRNASSISPCNILKTCYKRQRGEKKPIPEEQKDEKYFERRRRNNQAAKKSRDARKLREDQIALKATILEHENAILKAQLITLREEAASLRQMLLQKKTLERDVQICRS